MKLPPWLLPLAQRAALDPVAFAKFVGRDELGRPVKLAKFHAELQRLWNAPRSVVWAPPEHGKTSQAEFRVAFELGRNPNLRVHWVGNSEERAQSATVAVASIIDSEPFRLVFPGVEVDRRWAGGFELAGRPASSQHPSVLPSGFGNTSTLGTRCDLLVADDLLGWDETRTQPGRERAWGAWSTVHASRLAPAGRIILTGTAWHSDDLLSRCAALPGWVSRRFPIQNENGAPLWPERWSLDAIAQRRAELRAVRASMLLDCQPLDESSLVFRPEDIEAACAKGRDEFGIYAPSGRVILALDPATTANAHSDESGLVMVCIDDTGFRHLTHVEGLRLDHRRLAERVAAMARANRAVVWVESNAGGNIIAGMIRDHGVAVKEVNTSRSSKTSRVEALCAELPYRWSFFQPRGAPTPELKKLLDELLTFTFESHCGDRLAALLVAVEAARSFDARPRRASPWVGSGSQNSRFNNR
jgi:hypothetical protein